MVNVGLGIFLINAPKGSIAAFALIVVFLVISVITCEVLRRKYPASKVQTKVTLSLTVVLLLLVLVAVIVLAKAE